MVETLASTAEGSGSTLCQETRIPHAAGPKKRKKKDSSCEENLPVFIFRLFSIPNAENLNVSSPLRFLFCLSDGWMVMIHLPPIILLSPCAIPQGSSALILSPELEQEPPLSWASHKRLLLNSPCRCAYFLEGE